MIESVYRFIDLASYLQYETTDCSPVASLVWVRGLWYLIFHIADMCNLGTCFVGDSLFQEQQLNDLILFSKYLMHSEHNHIYAYMYDYVNMNSYVYTSMELSKYYQIFLPEIGPLSYLHGLMVD